MTRSSPSSPSRSTRTRCRSTASTSPGRRVAPMLTLIGGALLLLVADSLGPQAAAIRLRAVHHDRCRRGHRLRGPVVGPGAGPGREALLHPGPSRRRGRLLRVRHRHHRRRGDPRRAPPRRLAPARGHGGRRALRPHAAVGIRRRDDGVGQRPDRDVPRPRDPLHRRVRAGRHAPAQDHLAGSRREVLRARRLQLRLLPLRHRPHLRRHGLHEPRRHRRLPRHHRPRRHRPRAGRPRAAPRGLRVQGGGGAVPLLDARRVPGRAQPERGVDGVGREGRRLRRPAPRLLPRLRHLPGRLAADRLRRRRPHDGRRLGARRRADRREAHARLQLDQPRRLRPRGRAGGERAGRARRRSSTWPPTRSWSPAASASSR